MQFRTALHQTTFSMKCPIFGFALVALLLVSSPCEVSADGANPIQKVIQLMTKLQAEVIDDGNAAQATYDKFTTWCGSRSRELLYEISTAKVTKEKQEAKIAKAATVAQDAESEIKSLVAWTATAEADLRAIKLIREKEAGEFQQMDKELSETLLTLKKAREILGKPQSASFLQRPTEGMNLFMTLVGQLVDAESAVSDADRSRLISLVQGKETTSMDNTGEAEEAQDDAEDDAEDDVAKEEQRTQQPGYETAGSRASIPDILRDMEDKTEQAQRDTRRKEMESRHKYEMFKAQLESRLKVENKELDVAKKASANALEVKAATEGSLAQLIKDFNADEKDLHNLQHTCMERATEFRTEMTDRKQEMEALTEAKKTIQGMSDGALLQTSYSFLQVGSTSEAKRRATERTTDVKALKQVSQLAKDEKSSALMQLSSRITAVLRYSAHSGTDPFAKVKELIESMIMKLEDEKQSEEAQKEFCDKEMKETEASKEEHEGDIEALTTRLEKTTTEASKLRQEVAEISKEITELVKSKAELVNLRKEEHEAYLKASADFKEGFAAVQTALKVLRGYYNEADDGAFLLQDMDRSMRAGSRNPGGGKSIIALLEVVESDISKSLAEAESAEDMAQEEYQKISTENVKTQERKGQDMKFKTAEATALDKQAAEYSGDQQEKEQELGAILEYYEKLKPQCVQQPESFEERREKRTREIKGLQEALALME